MEEAGIPTIYLGSCRDMMARVRPPRSAFLNFPLGRILKSALDVLVKSTTPGDLVDLPHEWGTPFDWKSYWHDLDEMIKEEGIQAQEWKPKD